MALIKAETAQGFSALPALRQIGLMVGLAASVALGVAVVLWSQSPSYSLLYGSLSDQDKMEVLEALQKAGIEHKVDEGSGAVMVPSGKVHEARMHLAGEGLPNGNSVGFEVLQKEQELGTSEFVEKARYQHALEVELGRSVSNLRHVRRARVHLAIPKRSVFVRDREPPSASVVLDLYAGRQLPDDQVAAVVHLVASSIPSMSPDHVTVVDQHGNLLTRHTRDKGMGLSDAQFEYTRRLEETYRERIEDLLSPIVGRGRVRAQVVAEVDFTMTESTREQYNPDGSVIRSEEVIEDRKPGSQAGPGGVPGALSNEPPEAGTTSPEGGAEAEGETANPPSAANVHSRSVRNYELDKTISHVRNPAGKITRLSVAVILDDKQSVDTVGNVERTPLSDQELAKLTALVKDAVGFNAERGDTVNLVNSSFQRPAAPEPIPEPPLWERPWLQSLVKQVLGGVVVLLLVFGVLRPVLRNLAERGSQVRAGSGAAELGGQGGEQAMLAQGQQAAGQLPGPGQYENQLTVAKSMANQDPGRVAQVVKNWVANDA